MTVIIVESPTKAKTLSRFLGEGYNVVATYGHITDLPEKKIGIVIKRLSDEVIEFKPEYVVVAKQKERIEEIKRLSDSAKQIYLATDPDREGEAIAWHVVSTLPKKSGSKIKRIVFHEITKRAIDEAINNPREIDGMLVDAQQARRVLDRLVGYKLSPLLWKKVRRGSSAGRVQSVALRLVVEREREIEAFKQEEYWDIWVQLRNQISEFKTKLITKNTDKIQLQNQDQAREAENDLRAARYSVDKVEKKEFRRTPPAPFTTSTLQQMAANRLGWSAKKTMQVAQSLYEGGYITYHRTDSTNLAQEAVTALADYISQIYGKQYALSSPRIYKTKSKVAQEAHEAIRPTDVTSQHLEQGDYSNKDQLRLYELIWKRFVACQMAEVEGVSVRVSVSGQAESRIYGLEARGESINFDGWMKIYDKGSGIQEIENNGNGENTMNIPELKEAEELNFVDLTSEQKFTQPPARYNDASLIKALEDRGIGRPSTYAPTLSTIQDRLYVERIEKRFKPTSLGMAVNDFLVANFPTIIDYGFTALMEDQLDDIANGTRQWQPVVSDFYGPFEKALNIANDTAARVKVEVEATGEKCAKCQTGDVVIRMGRFGKFLACSRYPECDFKANYVEKINMACPKCSDGQVIVKRTKSRKTFFGCSNYPKCDFASWTRPTPKATEGKPIQNPNTDQK